MPNTTSGIGDPYWYEWLVGLLYVVRMLNPDNKIASVTLQSSETKSLDDVVVNDTEGGQTCIQVKHTREGNSFTFTDLLSGDGDSGPYLKSFSNQWKQLRNSGKICRVVLFTNRELGDREYRPDKSDQKRFLRPALSEFWPALSARLKTVKQLDEIQFQPDWMEAWNLLLDTMEGLSSEEKLEFLRSFELKAGQHGLEDISKEVAGELQEAFHVSEERAYCLLDRLCARLRQWATSMREKEQIYLEDAYEALPIGERENLDFHILPVCDPFFASRARFVQALEQRILQGKENLLFLTGEPGCGKTNIISYLASKANSIVTVRFHTFRPLRPGELYLSADPGISDARAFWGSLLGMFRRLLKGRLQENHVPLSSALIDSVDELCGEVLRLAARWAEITGKLTVIAVDGIDHAARAGGQNSFLHTLPPPSAIPDRVCLVLAGQPIGWCEYPDFLFEPGLTVEVPPVQEEDLQLLYDQYGGDGKHPAGEREMFIHYIADIAKGNTLSAVFAMCEAAKYPSFAAFEADSRVRKLSEGVSAYYEYLWKSALEKCGPEQSELDMRIAAAFSLMNRKLPAQVLCEMFRKEQIPLCMWKGVLNELSPVISYDEQGYYVFHNDVRLFLTAHYRRAGGSRAEISGEIADYLLGSTFDARIKHEIVFQLLKDAGQEARYVDVFTMQYVLEGLKCKRSPGELERQMLDTLNALCRLEDKRKLITTFCAVMTLQQYEESLSWLDQEYEFEEELPFALTSELKGPADVVLTAEGLRHVLYDVSRLTNSGEMTRAKRALERWLGNKSPQALWRILLKNEDEKERCKDVLQRWGKYARMLKTLPLQEQYDGEEEEDAIALFSQGWLEAGRACSSREEVQYTLSSVQLWWEADMEEYIQTVFRRHNRDEILYLLKETQNEPFLSGRDRVTACAWAVHHGKTDLCPDWHTTIREKGFDFIEQLRGPNCLRGYDETAVRFEQTADILYVLCRTDLRPSEEQLGFAAAVCTGRDKGRDYQNAWNLLNVVCSAAELERELQDGRGNRITPITLECMLGEILNQMDSWNITLLNQKVFQRKLLRHVISLSWKLPAPLQEVLLERLSQHALQFDDPLLFGEYWRYLHCQKRDRLLEAYFDNWLGKTGRLWEEELADREILAQPMLEMADELKWDTRAGEARKLLFMRRIGYVGRKDYSLYDPLKWFQRVAEQQPEIWRQEGLLLMNISEYASDIGDNRALVPILSAVADTAGKMGAGSLLQFAEMNQKSSIPWKDVVFDGVIAALETCEPGREELIAVWKCTAEYFMVYPSYDGYDREGERDKIYVADIHEAIRLCAGRMRYDGIEEELQALAPNHFEQPRISRDQTSQIVPERWYDRPQDWLAESFWKEVGSMDLDKAFEIICQRCEGTNPDWRLMANFLCSAEQRGREQVDLYKSRIMDMVLKRDPHNSLEWDSCWCVYNVLFPYLDEEDIDLLFRKTVQSYRCRCADYWQSARYGLVTDLSYLAFALFSRYSLEDNLSALQEILEMHCIWLTGERTFTLTPRYCLKECGQTTGLNFVTS